MKTLITKNKKSHQETLEYWTEERKASAKRKPHRIIPPNKSNSAGAQPKGKVRVGQHNVSVFDNIELLKDVDSTDFLAKPVARPGKWPNSCNGKLYFTWKGQDYVGSAGSIYLEVLLTAAHNIYDEGAWSTNILYDAGHQERGKVWSYTSAVISGEWMNNENYAYDYSMILTDSSMKSVGSIAPITNYSPIGKNWIAYGFPADNPYPGDKMYKTRGKCVSYVDGIIGMDHNDMTKGSSGGNWKTKYGGGGQFYVNSVNSHGVQGEPSTMYGPYLDTWSFYLMLNALTN